MNRLLALVALLSGATLLVACPPNTNGKSEAEQKGPERSPVCTRFGQTCQYAPGKLGVCTAPEGCTGNDCLVCQSQH